MKIKLVILVSVLILFVLVSVALAEQRYFITIPGWGNTRVSGEIAYSLTRTYDGLISYYNLVNLRAWGNPPNPLKDEDQRTCYNCLSTSEADVANFYIRNKTAKHFMGFSGTWETTYTSTIASMWSNWNCWAYGC